MESLLDDVRRGIRRLRRESASTRRYVDPNELRSLLDEFDMTEVCKACGFPAHKCDEYGQKILDQAYIIFAILSSIPQESAMNKFIERRIDNNKLPLDRDRLVEIQQDIKHDIVDVFLEAQWTFIPFVLESGHQEIYRQFIIPFDKSLRLSVLDGSFGYIYEETFLASMQKFVHVETRNVTVIRKQLRSSSDSTSFQQEQEVLELLQLLHHPNIVELFCSYTYHGEHSLLFPRLEMDLEQFFGLTSRFGDFQRNSTFYTAVCGLSSALQYVHNLRLTRSEHRVDLTRIGYHHDIRPRNVLVTANTFLLTDFGLAKLKGVDKGSQSIWKDVNSDYIAPECVDIDFHNQNVGRPVDIWAFGCLVIDTVSYMAKGSQGRSEAQQRRSGSGQYPYFTESWFFAGKAVKRGVKDWVLELRGEVEDTNIHALLDLSLRILEIEPKARPNAADVYRKCSHIATRALIDSANSSLKGFDTSATGVYLVERLTQWGESFDFTIHQDQPSIQRHPDQEEKFRRFYHGHLQSIFDVSSQDADIDTAATPIELSKRHQGRVNKLGELIQELWSPASEVDQDQLDLKQIRTESEVACPTTPSTPMCRHGTNSASFNSDERSKSASAGGTSQNNVIFPLSPGLTPALTGLRLSSPRISNLDSELLPKSAIPLDAIKARVTYTDQSWLQQSLECNVEIVRHQIHNKTTTSIVWTDSLGGMLISHLLSKSESEYPHAFRPMGTNESVYFLGRQVLVEHGGCVREETSPILATQGPLTTRTPWSPLEIQAQTVAYSIASNKDRTIFREQAWGKRLLAHVGVDEVSLPWWRPAEAKSVGVSLWESGGIRTLVVQAQLKKDRRLLEFRGIGSTLKDGVLRWVRRLTASLVAPTDAVKKFKESSNTLVLRVWSPRDRPTEPARDTAIADTSSPMELGKKAYSELQLRFRKNEGTECNELRRALQSPVEVLRQDSMNP